MNFFKILKRQPKKIALVLGGGAARGLSNLGIIKVIKREAIPVQLVVGTSIGGLIGAVYALGISTERTEKIALKFSRGDLFDFTLPKMGLAEGDKLHRVIKDVIRNKGYNDIKTPLAIVATDIENGEEVVYAKGPLSTILRASCSLPGLFNPVRLDGKLLVDGGIKNSVPVSVARSMGADFIIACDVGFCVKTGSIDNIFQLITQSIQIMGNDLNKFQAAQAEVIIKPQLGDIDQMAFHRSDEAIKEGERAAEAAVKKIKKKLRL